MKLELSDLNNGCAFIGDKLTLSSKFAFEEDDAILWSGIRLITNPPCKKELQIAKEEVFSKGTFEAGEYIRNKSLLIKSNVVPTIKDRKIAYTVQLLLRKQSPINPEEDIDLKKDHTVEIKIKESNEKVKVPNPVSFSISGLNVNLTKDVFKPGETIKVNYTSDGLKEIEVRLLQKANLVCYCESFGKSCRNIDELPPAIAGDAKTTNTDKGFLLLKIPEIAESSHNYLWEPQEKEYWGFKFGDYSQWSLLVLGKQKTEFGRDLIKFEVPLFVTKKAIIEEKMGLDLFSGLGAETPINLDTLASKFQKTYKLVSVNNNGDKYSYAVKVQNISKETLKGVTLKVSGLQEGLFETAPALVGFNEWRPNEQKELLYEVKQDVSALILILEDNSQRSIRIQSPLKNMPLNLL